MAGVAFCDSVTELIREFFKSRDAIVSSFHILGVETETDYWLRVARESASYEWLRKSMDELVKKGYGIMLKIFSAKVYSLSPTIKAYLENVGYAHFASIFITCFPYNLFRYCARRNKAIPNNWDECFHVPRHSNDIGVAFANKVIMQEKHLREGLLVSPNITFIIENVVFT